MSSKLELAQQLRSLQAEVSNLEKTAERAFDNLANVVNAQAQQITKLTALVVVMHKIVCPESYNNANNDTTTG